VGLLNVLDHDRFKVVISSTYRMGRTVDTLAAIFAMKGLELEVISKTRKLSTGNRSSMRGLEIHEWLERTDNHDAPFVIIDDDSDMGPLSYALVKTNRLIGLEKSHIDTIVKRFGCTT
jgi:hypothetical protein